MYDEDDKIRGARDTYVVDHHIGSGGFGHTYRAQAPDGEYVAVKVLRIEKLDDWKALELFEREARALRRLDHEQIPRYIEFFAHVDDEPVSLEDLGSEEVHPNAIFLVQHYVDGVDLKRRLQREESFTTEQVESILRQTLEILTYLHELHPPVVHRDINPKNMILDDDGRVSVVDFGAIQEKLRAETVGGSTSVGTLGYIPIEQSFGKARPASDLYALGVTALALMTGSEPSDWPIDDETSKIDLSRLGLAPDEQPDGRRRRLLWTVDRMLEPLVSRRVDSAREALDILDDASGPTVTEADEASDGPAEWKRYVFHASWMLGLGSGSILYIFFFNDLSETELVRISWMWILPTAFGLIGLAFQNSKRPILYALMSTVIASLILACFFAGLWSSL
jgi:serine/threonine protein kinase